MILNILGWLFGILLVMTAFGVMLSGAFFYGLVCAIGGSMLIPPIRNTVKGLLGNKLSGTALVIGGLILSFMAIGAAPIEPVETTTQTEETTTEKEIKPAVVVPPTIEEDKTDKNCKVIGITDGDTFTCLMAGNEQVKIRMNQIDAPEKKQDYGNASKKYLSSLIGGKDIRVDTGEIDKYGRTIGDAYVDDVYINKKMVEDGYAWAYRRYVKDEELLELEKQARLDMKGLWGQPDPIYPSEYRNPERERIITNEVNPSNEILPLVSTTTQVAKSVEPTAKVEQPKIESQKFVEQKAEPKPKAVEPVKPKPQPKQRDAQCGSKRYCKQMSNCAEAKFYLNQCGLDRLDRDRDGIPCESICL